MNTLLLIVALALPVVSDSTCVVNLTRAQLTRLKIQLYRQLVDLRQNNDSLEAVIEKLKNPSPLRQMRKEL
jgi:hypothetical protein